MVDDEQFLVLQGPDGAMYAVPLDVLEQARLPDAAMGQVAEALDEEVGGFSARFFNGKLLTASSFDVEQSYKRPSGFNWNEHLDAVRMKPRRIRPDDG